MDEHEKYLRELDKDLGVGMHDLRLREKHADLWGALPIEQRFAFEGADDAAEWARIAWLMGELADAFYCRDGVPDAWSHFLAHSAVITRFMANRLQMEVEKARRPSE